MKIRNKMFFTFIISIAIPVAVISIVVSFNAKDKLIASNYQLLERELSKSKDFISLFVKDLKENIDIVVNSPQIELQSVELPSYLNENKEIKIDTKLNNNSRRIKNYLKNINSSKSNYVLSYIASPDGGIITSDNIALPGGFDPRERPWYKKAIKNPGKSVVTDAYESATGDAVFTVSKTITGDNTNGQSYNGVVGFDINLSRMTGFIENIKIGKTGYLMLLQSNGIVLADSQNKKNIFKEITKTSFSAISPLLNSEKMQASISADKTQYLCRSTSIENPNWHLIGLMKENEVTKEINNTIGLIFIIGIAAIVFFIIVAYLLSSLLSKNINKVISVLKSIINGDLTQKIETSSKDEIGEISGFFNTFLKKLRSLIVAVKKDSTQIAELSTDLASQSQQYAANVHEVTVSISSISDNMAKQQEMTKESSQDLQKMLEGVEQIDNISNETNERISEASTAVHQMTESIKEIAQGTETGDNASKELIRIAEDVRNKVNNMEESINKMQKGGDNIQEMVTVIQDIAEQTNLLAINASIEAAHAGEAGKGFAVVAGEIGSLAEKSGKNAQDIQDVVKQNNQDRKNLMDIGNNLKEAYDNLNKHIEQVKEINQKTKNKMQEQQHGSDSILNVITSLKEIGKQIEKSVQEERENGENIRDRFNNLKQLSDDVTHAMEKEQEALEENSNASEQISNISKQLKDISKRIEEDFQTFTVEKE